MHSRMTSLLLYILGKAFFFLLFVFNTNPASFIHKSTIVKVQSLLNRGGGSSNHTSSSTICLAYFARELATKLALLLTQLTENSLNPIVIH